MTKLIYNNGSTSRPDPPQSSVPPTLNVEGSLSETPTPNLWSTSVTLLLSQFLCIPSRYPVGRGPVGPLLPSLTTSTECVVDSLSSTSSSVTVLREEYLSSRDLRLTPGPGCHLDRIPVDLKNHLRNDSPVGTNSNSYTPSFPSPRQFTDSIS